MEAPSAPVTGTAEQAQLTATRSSSSVLEVKLQAFDPNLAVEIEG